MNMSEEEKARLVRSYVEAFAPLMSMDEPGALTHTIAFIAFVCQVPEQKARMALLRGMVKCRREGSQAYNVECQQGE